MKEHLYEVDLMRAFIIFGVVCVHVISFFNLFSPPLSETGVGFEAALTALHFTRESFMFITGLVLFITYYNRPFKALSFWSKRFKLIFIPYAAFTLLYILFSGTYLKGWQWTLPNVMGTYGTSLLDGHQFYLYYLVISMQLYLFFPLFVMFMKKLKNWHTVLFISSFALQIALMWVNKAVLQNMDTAHFPQWLALLLHYRDRYLITYQFWFISGALFAIHYEKIKAYVLEHAKLVYGVLAVVLLALWAHYALDRLVLHQDETMSVLVLQPMMIPFSFAVTVALWRAGMSWSKVRLEPGVQWFSRFVKVAAAASFGVFLVHPLILHFVEIAIYRIDPSTPIRLLLLPAAIAVVYGGGILIARLIGNIPLLSYIVGQKSSAPKHFKVGVTRASQ